MTSDQSLVGSHLLRIERTIHNMAYTIKQTQVTVQATRLNIHGSTTSDQLLARSHASKIKRIYDTSIDMSQATTQIYMKE